MATMITSDIFESLPHGSENAVSVADLCRALRLTPRALRQRIADARAAGMEILYRPGGHGGYFLPSLDPVKAQQERLAFYSVMKARALSTFEGLRPVAQALGRPLGQIDLLEDIADNESKGEKKG